MTTYDLIDARDQWLPQQDYDFIVAHVPVLCVDLILLSEREQPQVGLIERATPDGGTGWCLVGGRVMRDESLAMAVNRHLRATLGGEIRVEVATLQPVGVIEYFSEAGIGEFHDPRKHAVSVTYSAHCIGTPRVQIGTEALAFSWYRENELKSVRFGFGQDKVMNRFLQQQRLRAVLNCPSDNLIDEYHRTGLTHVPADRDSASGPHRGDITLADGSRTGTTRQRCRVSSGETAPLLQL